MKVFLKTKVKYFFIVALLLQTVSCSGSSKNIQPEIFSDKGIIRRAEIRDHNFCLDRSKEIPEEYTAHKVYWQCRLQFTNSRKSNNREYNQDVKKVRKRIKKKLKNLEKSNILLTNEEIEREEHRKCLSKGFNLNTEDKRAQEKYYQCRSKLASKRDGLIIIGERSYLGKKQLSKVNEDSKLKREEEINLENVKKLKELEQLKLSESDNIDFNFSSLIYQKAATKSSLRKKYPECSKYSIGTNIFNSCKNAMDAYSNCNKEIPEKLLKYKVDIRVECEKEAINKYPDSLISPMYSETDFNSGPTMSRVELNKKRQDIVTQCNSNNDSKEKEYKEKLLEECKKIKSNWK